MGVRTRTQSSTECKKKGVLLSSGYFWVGESRVKDMLLIIALPLFPSHCPPPQNEAGCREGITSWSTG